MFSPVLFNSIDWTETELFKRPPSQLADYLNDDRVFGIHLWNWQTESLSLEPDSSLLGQLSHAQSLPLK